jgi:class 3 adenylate cyclase/tetratricopeptide (TPR) repeat protein
MGCAGCGHENPPESRFCNECGGPLAAGCTSCGGENPASAKFCNQCGASLAAAAASDPEAGIPERSPRDYTPEHLAERILRSKSAIEGEHKQVTVLFADVKGSMVLAEELGAEEWHRILDRFFQLLADGVHRFEGTVNQYTGDGIMALFGAPIAHEDHAQRACYAALQIRQEVGRYANELKRERGLTFSTRLGLHSGEVVVGKIGDDLRMDYTARGQTVGLAQRMEALASPDTCYLTGETAALTSGYFELESLGDFQVKGVTEPVPVHRLVGAGAAVSRFDISRARGLTRFVGRDSDMAILEGALEQAQSGHGQVVGIVAEAGTGKSRLSFEFAERCRARGIKVNQGTGLAHGKNLPYLPMLQVFRGYYGIDSRDDDRTVREKLAGRMLLLDDQFREALPVLFEFFGAPDPDAPPLRMDPDAKQRVLFTVLRRIVQGADPGVGAKSFVTLIEDLHWLDPGSEAFLDQWVDAIAGSSSFLLVNFRPEFRAEWMQKSYYHQIPLTPLGPDAIRELLDDLLGSDPSTAGLAEAIHERTGGNPFFTEEVVQTLIESGQLEGERGAYRLSRPLERLEVPASVKSVLAARIDRLQEREKQVLQTAAVIGKEFPEPILREASDLPERDLVAALAALKAGEFIHEVTLYPVVEYAFKHPLTQEVALGSLLSDRRRRTHAAVARAVEAAAGDKLDESAALLAHHFEEAGEALPAARWHGRAAAWVGRNDAPQSVRHMQRVLALTKDLDDSTERDRLRLDACRSLLGEGGWRTGLSLEEADRIYAEGRALAERTQDNETAIAITIGYGATAGMRGYVQRYNELAEEGVALIRPETSDSAASSALSPGMGYSSYCAGRLEVALQHALLALERIEGDPEAGLEILGFNNWGQTLQNIAEFVGAMGDVQDGLRRVREAMEICQHHEMTEALIWTLGVYTTLLCWAGEEGALAEDALRKAADALDAADRVGSPYSRCHAYRCLGLAHALNANWDDAIEAGRSALELARTESGLERESDLLAQIARAQLGRGDPTAARVTAEEAVAAAEARGTPFWGAEARIELARALRIGVGVDAAAEIERLLSDADDAVLRTGGKVLAPQILEERGRLAALRGEGELAARHLEAAREGYLAVGAPARARGLEEQS